MPVLSDGTIRSRFAELIENGDVGNAQQCSYEFTAATVYKRDPTEPNRPVACLSVEGAGVSIEPSELVWVVAKEEIHIPDNVVGLWVQTQTLSRKGLLLLNTTLIEPGYKGPLTAVFVNFGRERVPICSATKIAKVLFLSLDKKAEDLIDPRTFPNPYAQWIVQIAANAPKSFLDLDSLAPNLENDARERIEELKKEAARITTDIETDACRALEKNVAAAVQQIRDELQKSRERIRDEFEQSRDKTAADVLKKTRWWVIGALIGFSAAVAVTQFYLTTVMPRLVAEHSNAAEQAKDVVSAEVGKLGLEIEALQHQNEKLSKRAEDLAASVERLLEQRRPRAAATSGSDNRK